nr:unnamed protein product [Callosobruchus analis]
MAEGLTKRLVGTEEDGILVSKAKAKLILMLDPSLFIHVKDATSAKEVWDKLKKMYEDTGFAQKISLLRKPPGIYRPSYVKELFLRYGNMQNLPPPPKQPSWTTKGYDRIKRRDR